MGGTAEKDGASGGAGTDIVVRPTTMIMGTIPIPMAILAMV